MRGPAPALPWDLYPEFQEQGVRGPAPTAPLRFAQQSIEALDDRSAAQYYARNGNQRDEPWLLKPTLHSPGQLGAWVRYEDRRTLGKNAPSDRSIFVDENSHAGVELLKRLMIVGSLLERHESVPKTDVEGVHRKLADNVLTREAAEEMLGRELLGTMGGRGRAVAEEEEEEGAASVSSGHHDHPLPTGVLEVPPPSHDDDDDQTAGRLHPETANVDEDFADLERRRARDRSVRNVQDLLSKMRPLLGLQPADERELWFLIDLLKLQTARDAPAFNAGASRAVWSSTSPAVNRNFAIVCDQAIEGVRAVLKKIASVSVKASYALGGVERAFGSGLKGFKYPGIGFDWALGTDFILGGGLAAPEIGRALEAGVAGGGTSDAGTDHRQPQRERGGGGAGATSVGADHRQGQRERGGGGFSDTALQRWIVDTHLVATHRDLLRHVPGVKDPIAKAFWTAVVGRDDSKEGGRSSAGSRKEHPVSSAEDVDPEDPVSSAVPVGPPRTPDLPDQGADSIISNCGTAEDPASTIASPAEDIPATSTSTTVDHGSGNHDPPQEHQVDEPRPSNWQWPRTAAAFATWHREQEHIWSLARTTTTAHHSGQHDPRPVVTTGTTDDVPPSDGDPLPSDRARGRMVAAVVDNNNPLEQLFHSVVRRSRGGEAMAERWQVVFMAMAVQRQAGTGVFHLWERVVATARSRLVMW